jgi:hypothetical protein
MPFTIASRAARGRRPCGRRVVFHGSHRRDHLSAVAPCTGRRQPPACLPRGQRNLSRWRPPPSLPRGAGARTAARVASACRSLLSSPAAITRTSNDVFVAAALSRGVRGLEPPWQHHIRPGAAWRGQTISTVRARRHNGGALVDRSTEVVRVKRKSSRCRLRVNLIKPLRQQRYYWCSTPTTRRGVQVLQAVCMLNVSRYVCCR